ncbi:hypothetical protein BV22DRAFT_881651 [Leucogyrophana mollusca]|uniref:Uncharacterized protein n=1 Tax=Leucogyrophana mollusca TaxID=85980 RepID=A0ACB8B0I6_9AGAM|nr:hypothetical protein BV22DRAFT_881651 [Leucogyrophana mollusca]
MVTLTQVALAAFLLGTVAARKYDYSITVYDEANYGGHSKRHPGSLEWTFWTEHCDCVDFGDEFSNGKLKSFRFNADHDVYLSLRQHRHCHGVEVGVCPFRC